MKKKPGNRKDAQWAEAKRLCRLTSEDVRKAKQLSLNPRSLIKNRPSKSQAWKAPVHIWVRELYERMLERSVRKGERKANASFAGERAPPVARGERTASNDPARHRGACKPVDGPEQSARSEFDSAYVSEPEWDPARDDVDECPF